MADTNLLILAREFKNLRTHVQEILKMPIGPQGLKGDKGEQGVKGDKGLNGKDGKDGKNGKDGLNGQDGRNGVNGEDGKDGLDGVGVQNAYIDFDNSLVIVLTSGQEINAGFLSQDAKEAVVATFKQGAATLNELLPVQTSNSGKFLTTDGINTSWASVVGGLSYQGTWNASTNTPTLTSSVGTNGYYYVVAVAGSTNLNGITDWQIGDWLLFNGSTWQKIDQSNLVTSVNGQTGVVVLNAANVGAEPADATILKDADIGVTVQGYNANTVVDASYVHTDNNYTTVEKNKLAGIAAGAEVNVNADWNAVSGDAQILNKPTLYSDASVDAHLNTATATSTQVLSWTGTDYDWVDPSGGGSALAVLDEGTTLTSAATSLNFTGAGVTATNTGGAVTVAITGGGGGSTSPIPNLSAWMIGAM